MFYYKLLGFCNILIAISDHGFHHMSLADDDLVETISPPDLESASGPQILPLK